ncbi:50S ribosomal protein L23 [Candidatus Roizmanbacteria bacterium CG09_land_8_20_14_0_10_41_9]|uniref:Large ribosomal subunit protein uL23 n=1 Tax=Candidatus Roizmanbacteria bacterium CG09_land_8_20_14_0_10_41_9 TaxID=1974850 RepID=A0A2H0WSW7_9BACT|nr:MAG: 50S ribosomal protein L23 [Candidatus Roizmanbacteria bacterium CG09_land_8_20_14_0_10_41_9]
MEGIALEVRESFPKIEMKINQIIWNPMLTEKATNLAKGTVYMFQVNPKATKIQIRRALETLYKVELSKVRIMVRKGKERKVGKKMSKKQLPERKIAYVSLKSGKIDLFPQT